MVTRKKEPAKRVPRLSEAHLNAFAAIQKHVLLHGYAPTLSELAQALRVTSVNSVTYYLKTLSAHGLIRLLPGQKRNIEIIAHGPESQSESSLPLLGKVAAGRPIEAIEDSKTIDVPKSLIRSDRPHFVLQVSGTSMIEDHICDGDFVVIREQSVAQNGETVVALIDGNATLKRFYRRSDRIELRPANSEMKPIIVEPHHHNLRIAGVYVGLVRVTK